jgi:release factor glutamine methyltransferase
VARCLFGVRIARPVPYLLWDLTTLALKRALAAHVRDGDAVLEMGTGPAAILSLHVARRRGVTVTAAEVCPAFVESARAQARLNAQPFEPSGPPGIRLIESDLFSHVTGSFDVIFINPPYLPQASYEALAAGGVYDGFAASAARSASSGGIRGNELVMRFLAEAPAHLRPGGQILVGTNPRYLAPDEIAAVARLHGLRLSVTVSGRWNPAQVLVFERDAGGAPAVAGS